MQDDTVTTIPVGVHLNGSVNLPDTETVFRTVSEYLGTQVRRIPDGETGERLNWIGFQMGVLERAGLKLVGDPADEQYRALPQYRVDGPVVLGPLGYYDAAIASYQTFERLQEHEGVIPDGIRFQVSLPTPMAVVSAWVRPEDRATVYPLYREALFGELGLIQSEIPHDKLAIQWDVAVEIGVIDGPFEDETSLTEILDRLADCGAQVPADVEMGYHLCYGDLGHEHFKQPENLAVLVGIANRVTAQVRRRINWFTMPVPRQTEDPAFFEPLHDLRLPPETELYLGVVYDRADIWTTERLVALAGQALQRGRPFGVCTECGMGRVPADLIEATLDRQRSIAKAVR